MASRRYTVGNMDCANCAREVESAVQKLDGVQFARVDFFSSQLELRGDVDFRRLQRQVEAIGKTLDLPDEASPVRGEAGGVRGYWLYLRERESSRLALAGGALLLLALAVDLLRLLPAELSDLLYIVSMLVALKPIIISGINGLRINHEFNINALMSIAGLGALLLGEYLEAAMVIFLFSLGEALEGYTADRARDSLRSLIALKPAVALRLRGNSAESVPITALQIHDRVRVLPGESIPVDGEVISGRGDVDQAHITGESIPVALQPGDPAFAGSINGESVLELRVGCLAQDSTLSRIIDMLRSAQSRRAPSQRQIDRFAHVYTPAVSLVALAVALLPPLLFGWSFWGTADETGWLYRALAMLVIACPCALVISTPVTVISAITAMARRGVLIKGGAALEALAGAQVVAFDKTGTLTRGKLHVAATYTDNCAAGPDCEPCTELVSLAAAVEAQSTHPFAGAILQAAAERQLAIGDATAVENLAGQGVRGRVNGKHITLGSHRYFDDEFRHSDALCERAAQIEAQGQSAVLLHDGQDVRGVIALADEARQESRDVVAALSGMGLHAVMLSGDNQRVAQSIARQTGVNDYRAELLPADKVAAVKRLAQERGHVAMVGDGINDAPALAQASVGIAMGGAASAQAMETADVVLLADGLRQLPGALRRSRFARRLIRENIALSFGLKLAFLLLALTGNVTMLVAVLADMGMSLAVTLNGMRALRE